MKAVSTSRGIVLMLASNIGFCVMAGLIKYASHIDTYKTALFRFVIGLGLLGTAALFGKIKLKFVHGPFLFCRGLIGGVAVFLLFLSISKLGVGKGTVIIYSFPIFASIFGAVFLKERIGLWKCIFIITAFIGIFLLTTSKGGSFSSGVGKYELLSVLGAVLAGLAVVFVKKLHDTDSTYAIFFSQCVMGMWLVIIPANLVPCSIGYSGGALLLGIGIAAAVAQLLMTEGYRHVSVTTGSLLSMLTPVLNFFVGIMVFREPISMYGIAGAAIVLISCASVIVSDGRSQSKEMRE